MFVALFFLQYPPLSKDGVAETTPSAVRTAVVKIWFGRLGEEKVPEGTLG